MIDDGDRIGEGGVGREIVFEREVRRRYSAPYTPDRFDRRDDIFDDEPPRGYRTGRRDLRRSERRAAEVEAEAAEDARERRVLFGGGGLGLAGGFGMGGSGAALVIIGLLLMAIAYFGLGFLDPSAYGGDYAAAYDGGGYTPELPSQGLGDAYGGGELLAQRPMMFMGGGFLFMTGWLLVIASRLREMLSDDA